MSDKSKILISDKLAQWGETDGKDYSVLNKYFDTFTLSDIIHMFSGEYCDHMEFAQIFKPTLRFLWLFLYSKHFDELHGREPIKESWNKNEPNQLKLFNGMLLLSGKIAGIIYHRPGGEETRLLVSKFCQLLDELLQKNEDGKECTNDKYADPENISIMYAKYKSDIVAMYIDSCSLDYQDCSMILNSACSLSNLKFINFSGMYIDFSDTYIDASNSFPESLNKLFSTNDKVMVDITNTSFASINNKDWFSNPEKFTTTIAKQLIWIIPNQLYSGHWKEFFINRSDYELIDMIKITHYKHFISRGFVL